MSNSDSDSEDTRADFILTCNELAAKHSKTRPDSAWGLTTLRDAVQFWETRWLEGEERKVPNYELLHQTLVVNAIVIGTLARSLAKKDKRNQVIKTLSTIFLLYLTTTIMEDEQ